jgi:hypothetical protein
MEIQRMISELRRHLNDVDEVISALERLAEQRSPGRGKPAKKATSMAADPLDEAKPVARGAHAG